MIFPESVEIVEVAPRDGLQSLREVYTTDQKVGLVERLLAAGLKRIEVTSFVRPDVIPTLADAEDLVRRLPDPGSCTYRALVPNRRGAERAVDVGLREVVGLICVSEAYNLKNQNMTVDRNVEVLGEIVDVASASGTHVVVAVAMTMFCAYEGDIPLEKSMSLISRIVDLGVDEIYVATSAGADGPRKVYELCSTVRDTFPDLKVGIHLHNTNGMALANALAAMQGGVRTFESALCGIGGGIRFPHLTGNHGNLCTEDLVNMLNECGIETGVSWDKLIEASKYLSESFGVPSGSHAAAGATKQHMLEMARTNPWAGGLVGG